MKTILIFSVLSAAALAQPRLSLTASPVTAGSPAILAVTLQGGGMNPAALESVLTVPSGATITPGPALVGTAKTLYSFAFAGGVKFLIAGGASMVPDGIVATVAFPSTSFTFTPTALMAVDDNSVPITFTALPFGYQAPGSPCDLNGDGVTNQGDIDLAANQATGKIACGNGDIDGNGKCNSGDVQRVVKAGNGSACITGR